MWYFLAFFVLTSAVHITAISTQKEILRRVSKCLIVPFLLGVYICGAETLLFFAIPALIFGWIGDVLLIKIQKSIFFKLGLLSFLLGHICYIITFAAVLGLFDAGRIGIPAIAIFTPPALVLGIVVIRLIKPTKEMFLPVCVYMFVIMTMVLFGFQIFIFYPGIPGHLILCGCLCFMVSDTILAYYTFRKLKLSGSLLIMCYYILAQACIIFGLMKNL